VARLNAKDVPYLITILVAIAAWAITHVADRLLKSPVIEYSIDKSLAGATRTVKVTILNLSSTAFFGQKFELQGTGLKPCTVAMDFQPPAWASGSTPEPGTNGVAFVIDQLQPGWSVVLCGTYPASGPEPAFLLKDGAKQAIELRQRGLRTWIVKYETELIIALALSAILLFVLWLAFGKEAA